ncbi:TPA: hypothetical protein ACKR07_000189, partial [Pseudomonas aeruginosa]
TAATRRTSGSRRRHRSVLLELNPEYASIARHRLAAAWLEDAAQLDIFNDLQEQSAQSVNPCALKGVKA